ncbi:MAG: hypothetical protein ACTHZ9_09385 [Leucobacter sp.]
MHAEGKHSTETIAQNTPDTVHGATEHSASNGKGTVNGPPRGKTQDRPILDGASETYEVDPEPGNPWRGVENPQLTRRPEDVDGDGDAKSTER